MNYLIKNVPEEDKEEFENYLISSGIEFTIFSHKGLDFAEYLKRIICSYVNLPYNVFMQNTKSRETQPTLVRHLFCYFMDKYTEFSLRDIADMIYYEDHNGAARAKEYVITKLHEADYNKVLSIRLKYQHIKIAVETLEKLIFNYFGLDEPNRRTE